MLFINKIKYYFSKAISHIQIASLRECDIDKTARVCPKCNLIRVTMGRYSYMSINNTVNSTSIGAFCSIGSFCTIGGGFHPMDKVSTSPVFYDSDNIFKSYKFIKVFNSVKQPFTTIGNDVWIGDSAFIRAGVTIGDGAVIGAHSVVTKDVPPYAIVAGVPANVIKYRFDEETIKILQESNWFNWADEKLKTHKELFSDIKAFVSSKILEND